MQISQCHTLVNVLHYTTSLYILPRKLPMFRQFQPGSYLVE